MKEKYEFFKHISVNNDIKVVIPNLHISIKDGKVNNLEEKLKELRIKFKEKWKCDIESLHLEEGGLDYSLFASNVDNNDNI